MHPEASSSHLPAASYEQRVHEDKLRLLYGQSIQGVFASATAAALWAALMWHAASRIALAAWIVAIVLVTLARLTLFGAYHWRRPEATDLLNWEKPYAWTLWASGLVWGVGTVWAMPEESLVHHTITYLMLIGLAGAAFSTYGVFMRMTLVVVCTLLLPMIGFLLYEATEITVLLAMAGILFFVASLYGLRVHDRVLEQSFYLSHQLRESTRVAQWHAQTDELTGLNNRRAFTAAADAVLRMSERKRQPATMMLIDIDDFKQVNDSHSHAAGDAALQHLARLIREQVRDSDVCGRLGGDEFAVLLPYSDIAAAREVAEALRNVVASAALNVNDAKIVLSLSIGLATDEQHVETLLHNADAAMYQAKRLGKNQVALWQKES